MNISQEFNAVYGLILVSSFIGIILSGIWMLRNKKQWGYMVAPLFFFINGFLYTLALALGMLTHKGNEMWEGIIILHALFLFLLMVIIMPLQTNGGK